MTTSVRFYDKIKYLTKNIKKLLTNINPCAILQVKVNDKR